MSSIVSNEYLIGLLQTPLPKLEEANVMRFRLPLKSPFETSFGSIDHREILICEILAEGLRGYGECVADADPLYSYETVFTCGQILQRYLIPSLRRSGTIEDYLRGCESIRGHHMAKATVEAALWDLLAKSRQKPLHQLWGSTETKIPCGVSVGLQKDNKALLESIRHYLKDGYKRIKVKIKPGRDFDLLNAVRKEFPQIPLMADANAAYSLDDLPLLQSLEGFHLMMIEQPLHFEDLYDHSVLQAKLQTPVCLDESIVSRRIADSAIRMKSCRVINIKTGRVGGHTEAIRIHNLAMGNDIPVWCGGMLETGIGRAHNLALASLPDFKLPGDTSASSRYWDRDIIQPAVEMDADGYVKLSPKPGIGYDVDVRFIDSLVFERHTTRL
jgi:o-succinylbenzoate synthase